MRISGGVWESVTSIAVRYLMAETLPTAVVVTNVFGKVFTRQLVQEQTCRVYRNLAVV